MRQLRVTYRQTNPKRKRGALADAASCSRQPSLGALGWCDHRERSERRYPARAARLDVAADRALASRAQDLDLLRKTGEESVVSLSVENGKTAGSKPSIADLRKARDCSATADYSGATP